jgi:glycosyltransferase involved in cell wall biosynthesis
MGKIVILDPSLDGEMSHHFYAATALLDEVKGLGMRWALGANVNASQAVLRLGALPHFQVSGYHHAAERERAKEMETTALCNAITLHDLLRLERPHLQRHDLVFFPAITANMILGVAQWIATFPPEQTPCFGMCLMFQLNWHVSGRVSEVGELFYRQAFPFIPADARDRVVYTCETAGLADEYEPLVGTRPLVAPIPTIQHLIAGDGHADVEEKPVGFLGYAKAEKGFHLLPEIVTAVLERRPETRFVVQLMGHDAALLDRVRGALSVHGDRVRLVEGAVPQHRMVEIMQSAGLVLMPYDRRTYRTRGSAIFTEARSVGVPMVLPAGTAVADEGAQKGLAETFDTFDAPSVVDATLRALGRLDALTTAARHESRRLAHEDRGYLRPILEACGLLASAAASHAPAAVESPGDTRPLRARVSPRTEEVLA